MFRLATILALAVMLGLAPLARAEKINVFAAASLKNALDQIGTDWEAATSKDVTMVYASSAALAKQIAEGAPADLFLSADPAWMDELVARDLIVEDTCSNLLGNSLVLIAPADSMIEVDLDNPTEFVTLIGRERLAVGEVNSVPAGRYAKAALESLGLWPAMESRLAQAENVRVALAYVARGEAPFGIVYGSDALMEPKVKVVATFPEGSHPPIIYPVARISQSRNADAETFRQYLHSEAAREVFEKSGFTIIRKGSR